jgi:hypothetical protein
MPADPAGHGGCRLCRLAGRRMGQYAHLQQCARLVILALILGDLKLFEPKTMCPIIAVREREER